jgi:lipoyl(octanoyl) transferase
MTLSRRVCNIYRLNGLVTYEQAWKYQRALVEHTNAVRKAGKVTSDSLILLEHPSVYTLGRGATLENLKFETDDLSADHSIFRVERGGEVTWHGPGQLVVYPILDLYHHKKDLHWYVLHRKLLRPYSILSNEQSKWTMKSFMYSPSGIRALWRRWLSRA